MFVPTLGVVAVAIVALTPYAPSEKTRPASPVQSNVLQTNGGPVLPNPPVAVAGWVLSDPPVAPVWFGTWKVDLEKSTYSGAPGYKRATYTIEPAAGGLKVVYEAVLPRGGVTHMEWTGRLDGREYPVQGVEEFLTYAYFDRGDGSYQIVARIDGRVAATSDVRFSSDGRTMTTTTVARGGAGQSVTTTTVYIKQ